MSTTQPPVHKEGARAVISHELPVSCEVAFHAWAEPEEFKGWSEATAFVWQPAIGAPWFFEVLHEGKTWAHYGRFIRIEPPHLLSYTWMSAGTRGSDSLVTLELKQLPGTRTEAVLTHSGLPDDETARAHETGWKQTLIRFAEYLAKTKH